MLPKSIAHYTLIRKLSSGGMGEVYLAEDPKLGRKVALKVLHPGDGSEGSTGPARLIKEAQAAAKLDHPNVCQIFEVGESEVGPYIAMQFVEGETLATVMQRSRPSLVEIVSWGAQICDALADAHAQGIVHRDIKPANLMRTPKGQIKVLDFGLAKVTGKPRMDGAQSLVLTTPGLVMGTVPYMSPEQVRGEDLDGRTDLFSLGSILFEAAAGRRPFPAAQSADLMSQILLVNPFAEPAAEAIPEALRIILRKAMEKDRNRRIPSAQALGDAFRALHRDLRGSGGHPNPALTAFQSPNSSGDLPTSYHPSQGWPPPQVRRFRPWIFAAVAAAVLIPAGVFGVPRLLAQQRAIDSIAVLPIANTANDPELDYLCDGLTEQLINQLSHLSDLKVIARSSVLRYKGQTPDLKTLAQELGVKAVLMGRMIQRDGKLSLSVEFAETRSSRHIWGDQLVRPSAELLDLQSSLAQTISENLGRTLNTVDRTALAAARPTGDAEAYKLYLKGRFYADKWTPEDANRALSYFDQAIARDSRFALAHVGKAYTYWGISSQFMAPKIAMPKAREAAQLAVALDPNLAEAHAALGGVAAAFDHDFKASDAAFQRALALNPNSESALGYHAYCLIGQGRTRESIDLLTRAKVIDPQSPVLETYWGMAHFWGDRNQEEAAAHFRKAMGMDPTFWWPQLFMAWIHDEKGQTQQADTLLEKAQASGSPFVLAYLALRQERLGDRAKALAFFNQLSSMMDHKVGYVAAHHMAMACLGLGRRDEALDWLQKGIDAQEEDSLFLATNHAWDSLRQEPRFQAMLAGIPSQGKGPR